MCDLHFEDGDFHPCPRCSGSGEVQCHCGGDLCLCENHGDAPCPLCFGEGEISQSDYDRYEAERRKFAEALRPFFTAPEPSKHGEAG